MTSAFPAAPREGDDARTKDSATTPGNGGTLRQRMTAIVDDAARRGFTDAGRLWRMTPREAELALEGFIARRRDAEARDERLAWMAGYYCALAVHAPRRYPRRSGETFHVHGMAMTDAQMKDALRAFAAGRRMCDDIGNAEN